MKTTIVDDNQDFIFRFRIPGSRKKIEPSLDEFYRAQILDLARIVQFHFQGKAVPVDGFSFRNRSGQVIALLKDADDAADPAP